VVTFLKDFCISSLFHASPQCVGVPQWNVVKKLI
jgi:hypothetical protein